MTSNSVRICLLICNSLGITSLELKRDQFVVSKSMVLMNIIKVPIVSAFLLLMSYYSPLKDEVFTAEINELQGYSTFSTVIMLVFVYMEQMTFVAIFYKNLVNLRSFENLANQAFKQSLDSKYQIDLKRSISKQLWIFSLLVAFVFISKFLAFTSNSIASFFILLILIYSFLVSVGSTVFIISFGKFLAATLKHFKRQLKSETSKQELNLVDIFHLMRAYRSIYDLNEEFHKTFGTQMTVLACSIAIMTPLQVN